MLWGSGLARSCATLGLTALLSGCALWQEARAPQQAAAQKQAADKAQAARAAYALEIDAPSDLQPLLQSYLDLARFQSAPQAEGLSPVELDRLSRATPAQARSLLETQGYFNAQVTLERQAGGGVGPERVRVKVEPGPPMLIARVLLAARPASALGTAADDQDAPAREALLQSLQRKALLREGALFTQTLWTEAKASWLNQARAEGFASATWERTEARVDVASNQVEIELLLDSGPRFFLGPLKIEGLERQRDNSVRRLAGFYEGTPYSEKLLQDYQERLVNAGLYDSVSVDIDPDPAKAAATPVLVRLREAKLQEATTSVGYSANSGPRATLEYLHRRPLGFDVSSKSKLEYGRSNYLLQEDITSHAKADMIRNQVAGKIQRLSDNGEVVDTYSLRVGRLQETPDHDRRYFVEGLRSRVSNKNGIHTADAVSLNYHWTWRHLDSALLPTVGWATSVQLGGGTSRSTQADNGPFIRSWARLNWYQPLGKNWLGNARMEAGQVFARPKVGLPDGLLFRAGGDESVRGYGYRDLGPSLNDAPVGGRVMWTASLEAAHPLFKDLPQYMGAVFVDAGQAAENWKSLKPVLGYGVGLRWRSPVGPLRVDLAWPEDSRKPKLHFSVGIAF